MKQIIKVLLKITVLPLSFIILLVRIAIDFSFELFYMLDDDIEDMYSDVKILKQKVKHLEIWKRAINRRM